MSRVLKHTLLLLWTLTLTAQSQVFTWHLHARSTWLGTTCFSRLGQDFIPLGPPIHWCSKPWILFITIAFWFKWLLAFSFSFFFFSPNIFFHCFFLLQESFLWFFRLSITCLMFIILSRANIFNSLKQQIQKTYALFKHSFRRQKALPPHLTN